MNILSKILYGKIDVFSHSGSLSTGEGGGRGRIFLETKLIPCSDIVHIGFVVVGRGVMHVLEAIEH